MGVWKNNSKRSCNVFLPSSLLFLSFPHRLSQWKFLWIKVFFFFNHSTSCIKMKTNYFLLWSRLFVVLWFQAFLGHEGISASWLGVTGMWAESFTAAVQKSPLKNVLLFFFFWRKKLVSQCEQFDHSFSGDGSLVAWQLACFLLRLVILPKPPSAWTSEKH